jgi:hypothetical protein
MNVEMLISEETEALISPNPRVFTTAVKSNPNEDDKKAAPGYAQGKKNQRPQIVDDYLAMLFRISNNDRFHVPVRVSKLNSWAAKFRTGFPQKNSQEFATRWASLLHTTAEALSNQLIQIERAKTGRSDVGQIDGPDQKKLKDAKMADLAKA